MVLSPSHQQNSSLSSKSKILALKSTVRDIANRKTLDYHLYKKRERNNAYINVHVYVLVYMYTHILAWVTITFISGKIHKKLQILIVR